LGNTTYLGPNLEHVFERHARICKLILQKHDHIVIVLLYLLLLGGLGAALRSTLLDICLERSNLPIDARNVLFDDESEFLMAVLRDLRKATTKWMTRTLISTGRSSNRVLRLATINHGLE
jgi:hypothetical protein